MYILFTKRERKKFDTLKKTTEEEKIYWTLPNLIYPICVILFSILCAILFSEKKWEGIEFINILTNGSLAMFSINRVSAVGVNLFNRINHDWEKTNKTFPLRIKINDYSKLLLLFTALLYSYQIINAPFNKYWLILIQILITGFFIYISIQLSLYSFLLQQDNKERTVGDEIRDESIDSKNHLAKKYG